MLQLFVLRNWVLDIREARINSVSLNLRGFITTFFLPEGVFLFVEPGRPNEMWLHSGIAIDACRLGNEKPLRVFFQKMTQTIRRYFCEYLRGHIRQRNG